jgi:hypothetical protein
MRWLLLLGLLLVGCRYTFIPLDPGRTAFPERAVVSGSLEQVERGAVAKINVRRMPEANYLELRWFKEDQLYQEKSIWVEQAGTYEAKFDRFDDGYYRLLVVIKNSPYLQLEVGSPLVPQPPEVTPPPQNPSELPAPTPPTPTPPGPNPPRP